MTIRGLLNIALDGHTPDYFNRGLKATAVQQPFVTMYNFLNSSTALGLGIVRRAYNFGSTSDLIAGGFDTVTSEGTGMDYFDRTNPAGNNAWAVFEFTNANPSFWILIQYAGETEFYDTTVFGDAPGAPGYIQGWITYPKSPGFGISVAFKKDGSKPWGGTTNNNGADTKGSVVWVSGSVPFPRPNRFGGDGLYGQASETGFSFTDAGSFMTLHEGFHTASPQPETDRPFDSLNGVMHIIVQEDTLLILSDAFGAGQYNFFYFGKYDPIEDSLTENLRWANYCCLQGYSRQDSTQIILRFGDTTYSTYGSHVLQQNIQNTPAVATTEAKIQGGAHNVMTGEVRNVIIDSNMLLADGDASTPVQLRFPNRPVSDPTGTTPGVWDVFGIPISLFEGNHWYGHLGEISFIKMTRDIMSNSTMDNRNYAVFGSTVKTQIKLVVPWDGQTQPGIQRATRTGILW